MLKKDILTKIKNQKKILDELEDDLEKHNNYIEALCVMLKNDDWEKVEEVVAEMMSCYNLDVEDVADLIEVTLGHYNAS